jgi:phosphate-selective porin OprO/OprP
MTLDESIGSNDTMFIERATAAAMAASFGGGDGRSAVGVRGATDNFFASLYYTRGLVGEGGFDEQNSLVGRTAYRFAPNADANIHIGASATSMLEFHQAAGGPVFTLQDRPELRIDGTRLISTGSLGSENALVYGPELAGNWKNFYAQGEYYRYKIDRIGLAPEADFDAWYVQASYIVTGEAKPYDMKSATYNSPKPSAPFGFGSIEAVELAVRYSAADLDHNASRAACAGTVAGGSATLNPGAATDCVRGGEQDIVTLGVNWYPNRNVRFMLNYMLADIDRRAYSNNSVANGGPNAQIGQDYNAVALRTQFNW